MDKRDRLRRLALKIAKLLKEKYKVKRVFLIGSLVKGYVHDRSDIDMVLEEFTPELYQNTEESI
jgi:predicted nucleotidyltransferase